SFVVYIERYWLPVKDMWSAVNHQNCTIFELSDTNMLVEAWHHLLKGMFLEGKHNRPLDHLISILLTKVVPYFVARHRNQQFGFQGPDLEVQYRMDTHSRS
ncbi:hypothetical protein FIBSPDRAFT_708840, partial [Athelia psychrophila]